MGEGLVIQELPYGDVPRALSEATAGISFIKPVFAGDTLTVRGRIKHRETEGVNTRVTVEVWCENEQGVKTMVGTASGLEPDLRASE
jgi:acyl dehydratase